MCPCGVQAMASADAGLPIACRYTPNDAANCCVVGGKAVLATLQRNTCDLTLGLGFVPASFLLRAVILPVHMSWCVRSDNCPWLILLAKAKGYSMVSGL